MTHYFASFGAGKKGGRAGCKLEIVEYRLAKLGRHLPSRAALQVRCVCDSGHWLGPCDRDNKRREDR